MGYDCAFDVSAMSEEKESLYQVLEISILASDDEVRQAYRRQARQTHPDRHLDDPLATPRFQRLQHAYEVLRDPVLRNEYDKALLHRLYVQEYLRRCTDLILTASGLGLPLEQEQCRSSLEKCFLEAPTTRAA